MWPVVLEVSADSKGAEGGVADAICAVKEQMRGVPAHIRQYGLPFRNRDEVASLPEVVFNYLGQFGELDITGNVRLTGEPVGCSNQVQTAASPDY